ncbi:hypothetical protein HOU79_gp29 [Vibrio phage 1.224.A._10N.261.48.B1]|uniref:Uncharacterized protein n=1 Tax=Vibrio phage 1.224.A._10N.261.48.B1 TaxID=1881226 RepID=A0A2I7RS30_9CAUD|nr:hypothetical protein HOU79_gp29 [Vibrio phage 1.224.A._10N.261.48.B1]AUR96444.1 hypothetical protein NVP1224A_77 [Vibrio phage 1.224.A._10N.261.48.B1]
MSIHLSGALAYLAVMGRGISPTVVADTHPSVSYYKRKTRSTTPRKQWYTVDSPEVKRMSK